MGYSGYTDYLCEVGHQCSRDCHDSKPKSCPHCDGKLVWCNSVDTTNGSYCDAPSAWQNLDSEELEALSQEEYDGLRFCKGCNWCTEGRIDGHVELKQVTPEYLDECECCGNVRVVEPARFEIPKDKGTKI